MRPLLLLLLLAGPAGAAGVPDDEKKLADQVAFYTQQIEVKEAVCISAAFGDGLAYSRCQVELTALKIQRTSFQTELAKLRAGRSVTPQSTPCAAEFARPGVARSERAKAAANHLRLRRELNGASAKAAVTKAECQHQTHVEGVSCESAVPVTAQQVAAYARFEAQAADRAASLGAYRDQAGAKVCALEDSDFSGR